MAHCRAHKAMRKGDLKRKNQKILVKLADIACKNYLEILWDYVGVENVGENVGTINQERYNRTIDDLFRYKLAMEGYEEQ